jgi:hypothetical protein
VFGRHQTRLAQEWIIGAVDAYSKPGTGSGYAYSVRDSMGRYLDGDKTYKITMPAPVPAWSVLVIHGL